MYDARKGGCVVFHDGRASSVIGKVENLAVLRDSRTLYVCDSRPPVAHQLAFALVISSPKKENWSIFTQSPRVIQLTLPMFSLPEILRLRTVGFADMPEAEVEANYDKLGGSPRSLLAQGANAPYLDRLDAAGENMPLVALKRAISTSTALDGVADEQYHRLVNLVPYGALPGSTLVASDLDFYRFHHAELVSPYVVDKFVKHMLLNDADGLYGFLGAAASDPAIATFRGKLYERVIALPRVNRGGIAMCALQLRRLTEALPGGFPPSLSGDSLDWSAPLEFIHFRSTNELALLWASHAGDALFVPLSKEFPVADFVVRKGGRAFLANATVAESHDVAAGNAKFGRLLDAIGLGASRLEISLLWVLPSDASERFKVAGVLKGASGGDLVTGPSARHPVGSRVVQYAVCLPVPLTAAAAVAAAASSAYSAHSRGQPRSQSAVSSTVGQRPGGHALTSVHDAIGRPGAAVAAASQSDRSARAASRSTRVASSQLAFTVNAANSFLLSRSATPAIPGSEARQRSFAAASLFAVPAPLSPARSTRPPGQSSQLLASLPLSPDSGLGDTGTAGSLRRMPHSELSAVAPMHRGRADSRAERLRDLGASSSALWSSTLSGLKASASVAR